MSRSQLLLIGGLDTVASRRLAESAVAEQPGSVLVHHDLRALTEGIVRRTVTRDGTVSETVLELAHGCASCTLREDVLPLLRELAGQAVPRIVLLLDPAMTAETVCEALSMLEVRDATGSGTVLEVLDIAAVLTVLDQTTWLRDAGDDQTLAEAGLSAGAEDERTLGQLAVAGVTFADVLVLGGHADPKTIAALDRLAPTAVRVEQADHSDVSGMLARISEEARRGEPDDPHGPLLRGCPPLRAEHGIALAEFDERRPFHPERLHEAMRVLVDGVLLCWGRIWLASKPDACLWVEANPGSVRLGALDSWLAAGTERDWEDADARRQAMAALRWDPYYGDREQHLMLVTHEADPEHIRETLREALLSDAELAGGRAHWRHLPDPFEFLGLEHSGTEG